MRWVNRIGDDGPDNAPEFLLRQTQTANNSRIGALSRATGLSWVYYGFAEWHAGSLQVLPAADQGQAQTYKHLQLLQATHGLRIELSAAAGFSGPHWLQSDILACPDPTHLVWTTGGTLVPDAEFQKFLDWSPSS